MSQFEITQSGYNQKGHKMADQPSQDNGIEQFNQLVKSLEANPDVPKIYFNTISVLCNNRDVSIMLFRADQDKPLALLYTSYSVAKTLSVALADILGKYEQSTEQEISTIPSENDIQSP